MTVKRICAIYTRKSSDDGLDQAFNSLDAQREACEDYIRSQRSEGWSLLKTHFENTPKFHFVSRADSESTENQ